MSGARTGVDQYGGTTGNTSALGRKLSDNEFNVLLNPMHQEYAALIWSQQRAFRFDPRLFASEPRTL